MIQQREVETLEFSRLNRRKNISFEELQVKIRAIFDFYSIN